MAICSVRLEAVWSLLVDPRRYGSWCDAKVKSVIPPGRAHRGQQIELRAPRHLSWLPVGFAIESVDEANHELTLLAEFPLGLALRSRIAVTAIDERSCQVQFG